jgi:DNA-binding transcriptional LysR family regulator
MDKLKQMESFVSVVTRGSLTAAAQAEGVAPAIMGRRSQAPAVWASRSLTT